MLRARTVALACLALCPSLPAIADVKAQPYMTTVGSSGTTTYFGRGEALPAAADEKPKPQPLPDPTLEADIDLASQKMVVSINGEVRYAWPISSGVASYPTPTGTFRPEWTSAMWYSRKYDWAPMPHAVFINGGVAVHATYQTAALGSPASHGCIRLSPSNAKTFYNLVERHGLKMTRVRVFGKPNWRGGSEIASRSKSRKSDYASNESNWFWGPWGGDSNSAYAPNFTQKKYRAGYVIDENGVPRKVRRKSAQNDQRPPRQIRYKYGYAGSGYADGY